MAQTDFVNLFAQAERTIADDASALVRSTALVIEGSIKQDMTAQKHGRTYKRGGRPHVASAPGEAPAVDTGSEVNSITTEMDGRFAAEVGTPNEVAPLLEQGTSEIAPRPAWEKAGKKAENEFERRAKRLR